MCGVPYHAADGYLARLVKKGFRVAVCEQMEDPRFTKKIVKREIARIITPGTATDEALLDARTQTLLAAVCRVREHYGLAWLELSSGRFSVLQTSRAGELQAELQRLRPSELLVPDDLIQPPTPGFTPRQRPPWHSASRPRDRSPRRVSTVTSWPTATMRPSRAAPRRTRSA